MRVTEPPIQHAWRDGEDLTNGINLPELRRARLIGIVTVNRVKQHRRGFLCAEEHAAIHNARDLSASDEPKNQVAEGVIVDLHEDGP